MTYKDYKREMKLSSAFGGLKDKYKTLNSYLETITTDLVPYNRNNPNIVYYFKDNKCLFNVNDYFLSFSKYINEKIMADYDMSYYDAEYFVFQFLNETLKLNCTRFYSLDPHINYTNVEKEFRINSGLNQNVFYDL
jgi:hypothetical protein